MKFFNFIAAALSEALSPSSKRLIAFMLALTVCGCEIYHTYKKQAFDTTHLAYLLLTILTLVGFAQILLKALETIKGTSQATPTTEAKITSTVETKIEQL